MKINNDNYGIFELISFDDDLQEFNEDLILSSLIQQYNHNDNHNDSNCNCGCNGGNQNCSCK